MVTRRSRTVDAPADAVWRLATDPYMLPRWWPATQRVETVSPAGWTSVLVTPRGRTVRADYSVATTEPPRMARWRQDLAGTPFERLFSQMEYVLELAPAGAGAGATAVSLAVEQTPRGWARLAPWQIRRAAKRQLDTALAQLAESVEGHDG